MLTIGQLAACAGVTIRAVRHYHQRGLLPEPERDASGYRRYTAQAVVDLIRIRTLAEGGVPLARIDELLHARPDQFVAAVTDIDRALAERIDELVAHRRRLGELTAGERLFLPPEVVDILDRLRAMGASERMVLVERDIWIMLVALSPESVPGWAAAKSAAFDDQVFRDLYLDCDRALDWSAHDPRLPALAARMAAFDAGKPQTGPTGPDLLSLMDEHLCESSPAWRRLMELLPKFSGTPRPRPNG
jgi:DNA-binding transcriptional MerR regulator